MKKRILAIGAHPDDLDFSSAGTIVKFIKKAARFFIWLSAMVQKEDRR